MKWAIVAIATICLCACASSGPRPLDDDAREYVRLALAVGARDPDSLLGAYAGPPEWRAAANDAYRPLDAVRRDLVALRARLEARDNAQGERVSFLAGQVDALTSRIDVVRGARWPFAVEAERLFDVTLAKPDAAGAPPDASPIGTLVPPERVGETFRRELAICRDETRRHAALPDDESVVVDARPTESPWPAFTSYLGRHRSRIAINTAFRFSAADLLQLACHEGYPGHHTIYIWQDDALVRRGRVEFWIEPLFSPQAFLDEGAASYAPALVPGADPDPALSTTLDRARLAIAWSYLDGDLEFARAADALEMKARTAGGPFLKFVNEFRTYVAAYTAGRAMARTIVEREDSVEGRWRKYRELVVAGRFAKR